MKKLFLVVLGTLLALSAIVEAQRANRRAAPPSVEGAVVKGNRATAKAGYEFVRKSDNDVALRKKKKKNPPDTPNSPDVIIAHYKCSCEQGGGGCTVGSNGQSIFCDNGSCSKCGLSVTVESPSVIGVK